MHIPICRDVACYVSMVYRWFFGEIERKHPLDDPYRDVARNVSTGKQSTYYPIKYAHPYM